jgi:uncharacterized protein YciI
MSFLVVLKRARGWDPAQFGAHDKYLHGVKDRLIAFGPISTEQGAAAGYVYFTSHETEAEASGFIGANPLAASADVIRHGWRSRLGRTQFEIPPRPGRSGYFMWGLGTPEAPKQREALHAAHAAYFRRFDPDHFVARGPILAADMESWRGSAVAIEVEDRAAFDNYLNNEPFYQNGLYGQAEIFRWERGALAPTR